MSFQEVNDADANDANESIPDSQLDDMRALGMYGAMVHTLASLASCQLNITEFISSCLCI